MSELDRALRRHHEKELAAEGQNNRSVSLLSDFVNYMQRLNVPPIPIGYYQDLGASGIFGHRRAASFQQRDTGWIIAQKPVGMFVSSTGRLFRGAPLHVMKPGQKKIDDSLSISFHFPPKLGFAFCINHTRSVLTAGYSWQFKEVSDASQYAEDLARTLASYGA